MSAPNALLHLLGHAALGLLWLLLFFRPLLDAILTHNPLLAPTATIRASPFLSPLWALLADLPLFYSLATTFYFAFGLLLFQRKPAATGPEVLWRYKDLRKMFAPMYGREHFTPAWFSFGIVVRVAFVVVWFWGFGMWWNPFGLGTWVLFCLDVQYVLLNVVVFCVRVLGLDRMGDAEARRG